MPRVDRLIGFEAVPSYDRLRNTIIKWIYTQTDGRECWIAENAELNVQIERYYMHI